MDKKALITLFIIIFNSIVSCKQGEFKNTSSISIKNDNVNIKNNLTCQEIVEKIVNSSNLDVKIYKKFSVEIDNIKNDSILIHVYFENNLSEDPKQKQIVESTIAWLLLVTGKQKLYNITVDPEKPKELKFDKTILANNDIFKICNIQNERINLQSQLSILPFDFEDYYNACIYTSNEKKFNEKFVPYTYPESKAILENFGINEKPSIFFLLPKFKNFQPIILAFTDSDIETYYLKIANNGKIISSLEIARMDGNNIKDFIITPDYEIQIYTRHNKKEKRVLKKKYWLQNDGSIK